MDLRQIPKNNDLLTSFNMYRASSQTKALKSEKNRTVFCEQFENAQAPPLATICLKVIAKNYKGRPVNFELKPIQLRTFYDYIDVELPIENCINITDEYYWKRAYAQKCSNKLLVKQKSNEKNVKWKDLVITLKLLELIENTPYEIWIPEKMESITEMASPYVSELHIKKLQPMRETSFRKKPLSESTIMSLGTDEMEIEGEAEAEEEKGEEEEEEVEYDYPFQECHHVDLGVLKNLQHLYSITVEFLPPELGINYHSRYFNFSDMDVQNLASGVASLSNLKVFKIRRSRMDYVKLSIIFEGLKCISAEHVEFNFCQLDDECGESLYEFLIATASLKHFNLSGNYFRSSAIEYLAMGINSSPSKLSSLDLSNNPISDKSLCQLTDTLLECKELAHVTLSGIDLPKSGSTCIARLIKGHPNLEELEIIAVPTDGYSLVDALIPNTKIQQLLCQGCGLTLDEEFKVELLLRRNRYIKENPYIGDPTKTEEEINEFVSRKKNPVLLSALANMERQVECRRKKAERGEMPSEQSLDIIESGYDDISRFLQHVNNNQTQVRRRTGPNANPSLWRSSSNESHSLAKAKNLSSSQTTLGNKSMSCQ